MEQTTIAAISTPPAEGGIAIVRISGGDAISIADQVFRPLDGRTLNALPGYSVCFGHSVDAQGIIIDEGLCTLFRAPHSYTGEDVCEISCHGGLLVANRLLRACLEAGATPALAGEFTKRAFLNGKMSLTQAEAVIDIICAQSDDALQAANRAKEGALFQQVKEIKEVLMSAAAHLAAYIDFPEEDVQDVAPQELCEKLTVAQTLLRRLIADYDKGQIVRQGLDTVIVGKPNVGKSTLMNLLAGQEKSIVTPLPGTTRDVIEQSVRLGGLLLHLYDTAGLRETEDLVEGMGVARSRDQLKKAQLVLALFDAARPLEEEDRQLIEALSGKKAIAILNKCDQPPALTREDLSPYFSHVVLMSAKEKTGLSQLQTEMETLFSLQQWDLHAAQLANERQLALAKACLEHLSEAREAVELGVTLDAVEVDLFSAIDCLLELNGEKMESAIIDEIFSRFCVGK